ncbi:MAG TPA: hypothetical protein VN843_06475 [Anaerolineales bacterium]|nr:hypothetical protein [Anaerolineales bacterium]
MRVEKLTGWFSNSTKGDLLAALRPLFIALTVNVLILIIPPPVLITRSLFNFRLDVAFLFVIFLGLVLSRNGTAWNTISLTLTLTLFSIPLIYKWQTAGFYGYLIGGLLPWSDAAGYYSGAQHLIYDGHLTSWATRRPLFGGFLAVLLSATGNNLQISLAILAMLNGLALFLAAREIQKVHGSWIAATFLAICYWYYCAHAGITASEQLGLCFGSLGLAFFVHETRNESITKVIFGLFLLTVALNARAGAFFILPAFILWFGIIHHKNLGWRKPIALGIAVVVLGMLSNMVMVKIIGSTDAVPFSNYSYSLYGLASGNAGWSQVNRDHPDVKEEEVLGLALEKIHNNPSLFVIGILRSYRDYFTTNYGLFSFLGIVNDRRNLGNLLLLALTCVGLAIALARRKQGQYGLILAAFFGVFLSVGLIPPRDADFMRIYAATIPFTAFLASIGLSILEQPLKKIGLPAEIPTDEQTGSKLLLPFSIILLITCFIGPLLIKIAAHPQRSSASGSCSPAEEEIRFIVSGGSSIKLVNDNSLSESFLPNMRLTDFRNSTASGPYFYPNLMDMLLGLGAGQTISIGMYQQETDLLESGYLITNHELMKQGAHQICTTISLDPQLSGFFFYNEPEGNVTVRPNPSIFHQNPALAARVRNVYGLSILLIYVFASLSYFRGWSPPPAKRLFLLESSVLIFVSILVYLHVNALYFLTWEQVPLKVEDAIHRGGYSYEIPLGIDWMNRKEIGESPAIIYEDGIALQYPNTPPFSVERRGKGRFTIEGGNIILSSSDNSDPRENGRHYEIYWPMPIDPLFQTICYILTVILLLLMYSHKISQMKESISRKT